MDNFDHDEETLSGKDGNHDTILMLFQNTDSKLHTNNDNGCNFSKIPENQSSVRNEKVLTHILPCQILRKALNTGRRGEIPGEFTPAKEFIDTTKKSLCNQFLLWNAARSPLFTQTENSSSIPSFIATNSFFQNTTKAVASFAFTPIIPHPARV